MPRVRFFIVFPPAAQNIRRAPDHQQTAAHKQKQQRQRVGAGLGQGTVRGGGGRRHGIGGRLRLGTGHDIIGGAAVDGEGDAHQKDGERHGLSRRTEHQIDALGQTGEVGAAPLIGGGFCAGQLPGAGQLCQRDGVLGAVPLGEQGVGGDVGGGELRRQRAVRLAHPVEPYQNIRDGRAVPVAEQDGQRAGFSGGRCRHGAVQRQHHRRRESVETPQGFIHPRFLLSFCVSVYPASKPERQPPPVPAAPPE